MNRTISEPARAWAWWFILWTAAGATIYIGIWLVVWAMQIVGQPVGLLMLAAVVIAVLATVSWWGSGRRRP